MKKVNFLEDKTSANAKIKYFMLSLVFACALVFSLGACVPQEQMVQDQATKMLNNMSVEEKVGQLFSIRPEALVKEFTSAEIENLSDADGLTKVTDDIIATMNKYHLGGLTLFSKNIIDPNQTLQLINNFQSNSKIKMFISVDEEGGIVSRIASNKAFHEKNAEGGMKAVGKTGDPQNAFKAADNIGGFLSKYGFNVDFAPVCDVDPELPGKNTKGRSFSKDPNVTADFVEQYIKGLHNHKIMGTMKHFPGDGYAQGDTHKKTVYVDKTWEELKQCDLIPFERAISAGCDFAMIGHCNFPKVTTEDVPASLSKEIITDKLKGELGFKGIVVTDALAMKAVSDVYKSDEACIKALNAGVDVLLMPEDFPLAYNGVVKAVNDGRISMDNLNDHVYRVLSAKIAHHLI